MRVPIAFSTIHNHFKSATKPRRSQLAGRAAGKAIYRLQYPLKNKRREGRERPGPARVLLVYSQLDRG